MFDSVFYGNFGLARSSGSLENGAVSCCNRFILRVGAELWDQVSHPIRARQMDCLHKLAGLCKTSYVDGLQS